MAERARSSRAGDPVETPAGTRAGRRRIKDEADSQKPPARAELRILESRVFRGPNFWSYEPCIRMLVDLGSLEHWPSTTLKVSTKARLGMLPGLGAPFSPLGRAGG